MASFSIKWVEECYESLEAFAAEDECYKIYKYKEMGINEYAQFATVRHPQDELGIFDSQFVVNPVLIWEKVE